jgi:site-specific DNA-methyltransferase (cytosine-N4-specific)
MAKTLETWADVLSPGESAVVIVGHNRTTAGGEDIDIPTPLLLGDVAESKRFRLTEIIELETWPRYGLHSANGINGEDAIVITPRACSG